MSPPTPYLIINPHAGRTAPLVESLVAAAHELGIEPLVIDAGASLEQAARDALGRGATKLGIAGGDGSLAAVAQVAVDQKVPLVAVPTGTLNHFALDLGLSLDRPLDALEAFHGREVRVDVGRVNGRLFLNNVSVGVYADVVDDPDYRHHKLSVGWHKLHDALFDPARGNELRVRSRAQDAVEQVLAAVIANNPHALRGGARLGRRPRVDTGMLQVTAVPVPSVQSVNRALAAELGVPIDNPPGPKQWVCRRVTIDNLAEGVVRAGVDGEAVTFPGTVTAWSEPVALSMLVPAGGPLTARGRPMVGRAVERLATWLRPRPPTPSYATRPSL